MDKTTTDNAHRDGISGWEDEGGAARSPDHDEEERREKRRDDAVSPPQDDEVPANRREDPRNEGRQDIERKDRRSSS